MFSVKGWSVSSDKLKKESLTQAAANAASVAKETGEPVAPVKKPRKRKRGGDSTQQTAVTSDNVADLWETVIEGKPAPKAAANGKGKDKKKNKKIEDKPAVASASAADKDEQPQSKKQKYQDSKKVDKKKPTQQPAAAAPAPAPLAPLPPAPAKLTPLQQAMRAKLIPARFRHLNETLYTRPSDEALKLFSTTPSLFEEYHAGFRQQVEVWPENPVDGYVALLRARAAVRAPFVRRGAKPEKITYPNLAATPLPRTHGTCIMADLGCGDAKLAHALHAERDTLRIDVRSFDLHAPSPLVTAADIANLPLEDGAVDVAVFCLALMGTNWLDFIDEAYRILHWKGELWISEIKSRFGRVGGAGNAPPGRNVVSHSVGNRKKGAAAAAPPKKLSKEDKEKMAEGQRKELAVEVDGEMDRRQETDVSGFVEALAKRGFVLQGEPKDAIDLSNKMFVKMHFIKAAPPIKGKNVEKYGKPNGQQKKKWPVGGKVEEEEVDEDKILKPCVYKLR
ncbi:hypothetical protein TD95_003203 [Thielaviopsis punctulata]|uniref:Ribosomal RNA-processing protein 8 n=1 Tax=Thielaviopsis punctulata TaxID=72032 RepID=A0A0F4ZA33_9PEZI|nr:hypothetical protein TD95_003203 [Thielaviopsis punctulata]